MTAEHEDILKEEAFHLSAELLLSRGAEEFLSSKRVQLLENITIFGSISKAANASGITYKTAWSWIDKMNSLSAKSMVQRISGGKGGGGTIVTSYAKELICRYEELEALHQKHLDTLERAFDTLEDESREEFVFSRLNAQILKIEKYGKKATLSLRLSSGEMISAQAPWAFVEVNELKVTSLVYVLIESEAVSVSKSFEKEISSRNRLKTKVKEIVIRGEDVLLKLILAEDEVLTSQITLKSFKNLNIKEEDELLALFKAYSITLLSRGE